MTEFVQIDVSHASFAQDVGAIVCVKSATVFVKRAPQGAKQPEGFTNDILEDEEAKDGRAKYRAHQIHVSLHKHLSRHKKAAHNSMVTLPNLKSAVQMA